MTKVTIRMTALEWTMCHFHPSTMGQHPGENHSFEVLNYCDAQSSVYSVWIGGR